MLELLLCCGRDQNICRGGRYEGKKKKKKEEEKKKKNKERKKKKKGRGVE